MKCTPAPQLRQKLRSRQRLPRHQHAQPYAAVVLSGAYREAGNSGRYRLTSGGVIIHFAFDAHVNCVESAGAEILNIPLRGMGIGEAHGRIENPDAIAAMAEKDPLGVTDHLLDSMVEQPIPVWDWPDLLAADLRCNLVSSIAAWAADHGLTPASVSRGFKSAFSVTPKRFGLESKTLAAIRALARTAAPLSVIAADAGFADQAHMTRAVSELTGSPPSTWRAG